MIDCEQYQQTLSEHGYKYKKTLGKGGFSSVLLCESKKYLQDFAIKRAIKHRMTECEYKTLISLNHPNIIQLYDSFNDDYAHYLVMDYCPNGTLTQKGCLSYDKFLFYAKKILEAISFCHSMYIAHRDIKPDNILFDQYDNIKLADFGMANRFGKDAKSSQKCGSYCYLSPEMFQCREIDPFKADIWALGITFFYMITGTVPYTYETKEDLKEKIIFGELEFDEYEIDPEIRFLIRKMTDKCAKSRPTAEKILKMRLFSDFNDLKPPIFITPSFRKLLPVYKAKSRLSACQSYTFSINTDVTNTEDANEKPIIKINSYKSTLFVPGTQKSRFCFQPLTKVNHI